MRRIIFLLAVCGFLAAPAAADYYAGTAYLSQTGNVGGIDYSVGSGGEYTVSSSSLLISDYTSQTSGIKGSANSFQSFCLERREYTSPAPVALIVSTTFGDGSPGSKAVAGGSPAGYDDLSVETAYLYTHFATGTLSNYDYANATVPGRAGSAYSLQQAIWFLEGESSSTSDAQAIAWITEATGAKNSGAFADIGAVKVLNVYGLNADGSIDWANKLQDQLYLVPVPGATLLGLLGLGVAGMKLRRRF
jgi:hypothetical protein